VPLVVLSLMTSLNALAYSDMYCNVTIKGEQNKSLTIGDWPRLLSVAQDSERSCGRFSTAESIATSIWFQAIALWGLNRKSDSLTATDRCIALFPLPDCHLERAKNLIEIERYDEAEDSVRDGKNLIQKELNRIDSERRSPRSPTDAMVLDSSRQHLTASISFADALVERIDAIRKGKATDEAIRRITESGPGKSIRDGNRAPLAPLSKKASFSIPLRQRGGVFEVMATLNSEVKVFFVVDSGASDVTIPESVVGLLIDNGSLTKADVLGSREYKFANGETSSGKIVRLRTLDLNGHILKDVRAVVLPGNSVPVLLGQSALGRLGSWSINTKTKMLEVTP
jgi:clan AA aspartic protease (TIGR02281 family)